MTTDSTPVQVIASAKFQRNLRLLAKRYRNIRNDVQPIIEQLENGQLPDDPVAGGVNSAFTRRSVIASPGIRC